MSLGSKRDFNDKPKRCCTLKTLLCNLSLFTVLFLLLVIRFQSAKDGLALHPSLSLGKFYSISRNIISTAINNTNNEKSYNNSRVYKILLFTKFYPPGIHWFGLGKHPFKKCMYSNCASTANKDEYNTSDAILISMRHIKSAKFLPRWRPTNQKWMMYTLESPVHRFLNYRPFNKLFNVTITYKKSSDIYFPHGHTVIKVDKPQDDDVSNYNFAKGKTKLVAWFVSNCRTSSKREAYAQELRQHINVDTFGMCGKLKCSKGKDRTRCLQILNSTYKFYLSFENSLCTEYITEKTWKILEINVVPIVLGGANYTQALPPHSYIDVRNFASAEHLAKYLKTMEDDTYNSYFTWKKKYQTFQKYPPLECKLCEYMNTHNRVRKVYDRLDLFWNPNRDCIRSENYYRSFKKT